MCSDQENITALTGSERERGVPFEQVRICWGGQNGAVASAARFSQLHDASAGAPQGHAVTSHIHMQTNALTTSHT